MGPFGRQRNGIRLRVLLFLLNTVTQCGVFCVKTEAITTLDLLEDETTAYSSITDETEGRDKFNIRTTVSTTNQIRHLDNLSAEEVTKNKPLAEAQLGVSAKDSVPASSKDKETVIHTLTPSHEFETTWPTSKATAQPQLLEDSTSPSNTVFMTTPLSTTESSLSVPTKDSGIAHALQDAAGTSTPTYATSPLTNATTTVLSSGSGLLRVDKVNLVDITISESASHSPQKATVTTAQSTTPTVQGSEAPTRPPGSDIPAVSPGRTQPSLEASATMTSPSATSSPLRINHWYIVAAVVVLATLILIICFIWNVRRRRNTGSTSFQNTYKKKNKKGCEDAWAGPVLMPEEKGAPMDVVEDDQDPSGKRLTLTTFFNKRKSRQCSVVLEEVSAQSGKSTKDEASPLLTPNASGQANGCANMTQDDKKVSPTTKSSPTSGEQESPPLPEADSQTVAVQEPPPAKTANIEALPPPPSPPPETDFPAPPPSPEMQASQTAI